MILSDSPAVILHALLLANSTFENPEDSAPTWPLFVGYMPDKTGVPDDAGAISDTAGLKDGRYVEDGLNVIKWGVQVRVRSEEQVDGWTKISEVSDLLERVVGQVVAIGANNYILRNVSQVGTILFGGRELGEKQRTLHSLNVRCTIEQTTTGSASPIVPVPGILGGADANRILWIDQVSDRALLTEDSGSAFTNRLAAGKVAFTLPADFELGDTYVFADESGQEIEVVADPSSTIKSGGEVSVAGGSVTNNVAGTVYSGVVQLSRTSATTWLAVSTKGTWSVN